jgi:Protein of unknown function (DUF1569)
MALPNIFTKEISDATIARINSLTNATQAKWGKMSVGQMLAHCNVTYEMDLENTHKKPGAFGKFLMKLFVKNIVVSEKPYTQNSRTAPAFIITESKDFDQEKNRLISYIQKVQQLGESHYDGKESHSFGNLNKTEWNNLFYKHLNHHLSQFGV